MAAGTTATRRRRWGALAVKAAMEHERLEGTVKLFGCPAEETLVGKVFMVRDGPSPASMPAWGTPAR